MRPQLPEQFENEESAGRADAERPLDTVLRERGLPKVADALAYSRNYAEATPHLTQTGKDHILGLCSMLEIAAAAPLPQQPTAEGVDASSMAQRFLRWRLPDTFAPDAGISFDRSYCEKWATWPTGTNLFTADQAAEMMRFVLGTSPAGAPPAQQPLDDSANNAGVATGSRNESPSESVTRGSPQVTTDVSAVNQKMTTQGEPVRALLNRWRTIKSGLSAAGCANELEHALAKVEPAGREAVAVAYGVHAIDDLSRWIKAPYAVVCHRDEVLVAHCTHRDSAEQVAAALNCQPKVMMPMDEAIRVGNAMLKVTQPSPVIARALAEWHEDDGNVMWFAWCGREWAGEPAWCGRPDDSDWPGYHTHWVPHPQFPAALDEARRLAGSQQ